MSEQTPTPAQIAAIMWLRMMSSATSVTGGVHARVILDSLDPALTNPQPALPTAPGLYVDKEGAPWSLDDGGRWWFGNKDWSTAIADEALHVREYAPFTRLVPERPPITRKQIQTLISQWYDHGSNIRFADAILALVNGTDR